MSASTRVAAADLNGQFRGKRVSAAMANKQFQMPLSALNVDIFGADIDGSPLVFESGDQDGILVPTDRGSVPLPWVAGDATLIPCTMFCDPDTPFMGDPRHTLSSILDRFAANDLTVIAACELEFYLLEDGGNLAPPINPKTQKRLSGTEILSLRELDHFDAFFNDVVDGADAMGLGDLVITDEAGVGQFEVTMTHGPASRAADDVVLLKELIKGVARNHGMAATFLAKPFTSESGNGLHTHFSVLDGAGQNVFEDTATLEAAIAGCLNAFQASTIFFAPHANSYARFVEGAHAPINATWGYDNRTVALRVPNGAPRIEHRVSGGDVNPYLMFAAIFGAALQGMDAGEPPTQPAISGNAYDAPATQPGLHTTWDAAIAGLDTPQLTGIFDPLLLENLKMTKQQELALFAKMSDHDALLATLEAV